MRDRQRSSGTRKVMIGKLKSTEQLKQQNIAQKKKKKRGQSALQANDSQKRETKSSGIKGKLDT